MWVAARRPAHKEQSLSYDIKGIVEQASAQRPPYMGSLCKEVRVFILVVMGMNTHTHTRAHNRHPLHQPPLVLILADINSFFCAGHAGSSPTM